MAMKKFKAESQKLLDLMINSIYTNKEIFLRELISNASDALDKLRFKSLTDNSVGLNSGDFEIILTPDKETRTLKISDNGIGMTKDELENNLGTIARSGSLDFKKENQAEDIDIIGQFGVGFYSAFMVASRVSVVSRAFGSDEAWKWESSGAEGYTIEAAEKETAGTEITLYIKENTETENYDRFLDEYGLQTLVKKYSDYIRYPIKMMMTHTHSIPKPEDAGDDWKPLRLLRRPGNPVDTGAWPPPMISMLERIRDGLLAVPENGENNSVTEETGEEENGNEGML